VGGWFSSGDTPPRAALVAGGAPARAHHNHYVVDYHCGAWRFARSAKRPVIRFQRSGWIGAAPCAQVVWNGDPSTTWDFDGLTSALWGGLGMGFSGIAFWGSDIGGFFALGDRALTSEMLIRWVQLGAVSGVMRTQHNGFAVPPKVRPQIYDDDQIGNWKRYAKLRTQLYPYIAAAADEYRASGLPIMRHLALAYPDDPEAVARDDEFLFGPDLLAAPVLSPGATTRDVYLPGGSWIDLWRSGSWDSASGAFLPAEAAIVDGARFVTVPAPLDELPLFVRAGAVLPLLPSDVDTLADYGDPATGLVKLNDRSDALVLLAFPRGLSKAHLFSRRERVRSGAGGGQWELKIDARRQRTWEIHAALSAMEHPFAPCSVTWNGKPLAEGDWSYDEGTATLQARVTARRGRLLVTACD
jgi:alpha-glucosidase (family GH31 glycosyl hydrolase)